MLAAAKYWGLGRGTAGNVQKFFALPPVADDNDDHEDDDDVSAATTRPAAKKDVYGAIVRVEKAVGRLLFGQGLTLTLFRTIWGY